MITVLVHLNLQIAADSYEEAEEIARAMVADVLDPDLIALIEAVEG